MKIPSCCSKLLLTSALTVTRQKGAINIANNFNISNVAAKSLADKFEIEVDIGSTASVIDIRSGVQPADPDTVASGTLLATLTFSATAFGAATDANPGGRITANAITSDSSADATGTAGYFRIRATGIGAADVADGEIGTAASDLNMNTVSITAGSTVSITSFTVTMPEG